MLVETNACRLLFISFCCEPERQRPSVFPFALDQKRRALLPSGAVGFRRSAFLLLSITLCSLADLEAQTILTSNYAQPSGSAGQIDSSYPRYAVAFSFVTGNASASYNVGSIQLRLGAFSVAGAPVPVGFDVSICSTDSVYAFGQFIPGPGSGIGSLTGSTPGSFGDYTYTSTGITLAANTRYWLVLRLSQGGVSFGTAGNYQSSSDWSFPPGYFENKVGAWQYGSGSYGVPKMAIYGVVPESSPIKLLLSVGAALLVISISRHHWRPRRV